jgi:hypothetical protein
VQRGLLWLLVLVGPLLAGRQGGSCVVPVSNEVRPLLNAAQARCGGGIIVENKGKKGERSGKAGRGKEQGSRKWLRSCTWVRMSCVCVCVYQCVCLVAAADLLEESAVSRYLGEFGEILA